MAADSDESQPGDTNGDRAGAFRARGDRPRRVFITAAEVSGDNHAAQLVRSLKQIDPEMIIEAHAGPQVAAAGAVLHRDTVTRAAMGWRGALRAGEIYRVLRWTRRRFDAPEQRPDLWIGVDSPSMNFHFARAARRRGIPTLQYVAPQLWAWAEWRMKKLRRWVDRVACILPFEEEYFRRHGVDATFVGHPLFDQLPSDPGARRDGCENGSGDAPVIGLLPGSRAGVAATNLPGLLAAARRIERACPATSFLIPTTPATHPVVEAHLKPLRSTSREGGEALSLGPARVEYRLNAFDEMVPRCDLCLTVSGTATLHVAALGVPMIVVYRANPLVWNLVGRWLIKARTRTLVNLLAAGVDAGPELHITPEFTPWYAMDRAMPALAIDYVTHPEKLAAQREKLAALLRSLDKPGASMNVAKLAMRMMDGM
jgi:lipid-A-disaccharide synthase